MKKLKIFLALLTIAITVTPIALEVLLYRDNLLGLVIPPEITSMVNGNSVLNGGSSNDNGSSNGNVSSLVNSLEAPQLVGAPQYNPETKAFSFTFNFTNPLETPISVDKLETGIVSHDDGVFLGNISIDKPLILNPDQTINVTALGVLSDTAINYFKTNSTGQNSINIDLTNLNIDIAGVTVQVDRQNIGNIQIPPQLLG